jgi:type I site-specific restriction-modification system R (restriction) subunit
VPAVVVGVIIIGGWIRQQLRVESREQPVTEADLRILQRADSLLKDPASCGKELDDKEVERSAAMKGIMGWVRLHPYNIAQKVQIVVEHFRELVAPLLNGRGKAMVVVGSRKEAVRWQFAIDTYIKDRGYVNDVIKGKLLESQKLAVQATNNTKEQFANSPDLKTEITNAVMGALEAHTAMSTQALGSEVVREGLRDILLGPARLYETLREQAISKQAQS